MFLQDLELQLGCLRRDVTVDEGTPLDYRGRRDVGK